MQVGKWLDNQGIDAKPCARPNAAPPLPAVPTHRAVEKLLAAVYAPWNDMDNGKHKPIKVGPHRCVVLMHLCQHHTGLWNDLCAIKDLGFETKQSLWSSTLDSD